MIKLIFIMCICINCRHVHNCTTYKLIQKQHQQYKLKRNSAFIPINTLIKININQSIYSPKLDWDLIECLSFVEQPGNWLIEPISKKFPNI
uniref:Ycf34 n=1 Tax=Anunuuluaehu liula TaxID=3049639 RepID=UPI003002FDD3